MGPQGESAPELSSSVVQCGGAERIAFWSRVFASILLPSGMTACPEYDLVCKGALASLQYPLTKGNPPEVLAVTPSFCREPCSSVQDGEG